MKVRTDPVMLAVALGILNPMVFQADDDSTGELNPPPMVKTVTAQRAGSATEHTAGAPTAVVGTAVMNSELPDSGMTDSGMTDSGMTGSGFAGTAVATPALTARLAQEDEIDLRFG